MLEQIVIKRESLSENINETKNALQLALDESKSISVLTTSDVNKASLYIKKYSDFTKQAEKIRKEIVQPLNDEVKEINNKFKYLISELTPEEGRLKKELLSYQARQREVVERELAEARKKQEEEILNNAIAQGKDELPIIVEEVITAPKLSDKNEFGITTVRQKKWRLVNIDLVPREFLMVDEAKVKALRSTYGYDDKSPIAGIEFTLEESIRR